MARVKVGDSQITLEEFNGRRGIKALSILGKVGPGWDAIRDAIETARVEYEAKYFEVLDRAAARAIYAPEPLLDAIRDQQGEIVHDGDGTPVLEPIRDEQGAFVFGPDPLGHLTEADWEANGQRIRIPRRPKWRDLMIAVFPTALEHAQAQVLQLLALCAISNDEYSAAARKSEEEADELLQTKLDDLLDDGKIEELVELAVATGELVQQQFKDKIEELGERVKNVLALFGLELGRVPTESQLESSTQETPTSDLSSEQTSSTDSPPPTGEAGTSDGSSTKPDGEFSSASSPA